MKKNEGRIERIAVVFTAEWMDVYDRLVKYKEENRMTTSHAVKELLDKAL